MSLFWKTQPIESVVSGASLVFCIFIRECMADVVS